MAAADVILSDVQVVTPAERFLAERALTETLAVDLEWTLAAGEELLTETSAKFRLPGLYGELRAAGLQPVRSWTDPDRDFSVTLAMR